MKSFQGKRFNHLSLPTGSAWLMTEIARSQGRQDLYAKQAPQVLEALREMALIQSAESSNRIEGITVEASRLEPLVLGDSRPRDRSEEEVQNYRKALNLIHANHAKLAVSSDLIKKLHGIILEGAGHAGRWKQKEVDIIETLPGQAPFIRLRTVSANDTPKAIEELCLLYHHALNQENVPPLLAAAAFILDFLCIHPFVDGNGRLSRLLTHLMLYHQDIGAGRYVSIERLIEESGQEYYEALKQSSKEWHSGKHDLIPWLNYFLTIIRRTYREFEQRAEKIATKKGAKTGLLLEAIDSFHGEFTVRELQRAAPGASIDLIRRVLHNERRAGHLTCSGRGPGAKWKTAHK